MTLDLLADPALDDAEDAELLDLTLFLPFFKLAGERDDLQNKSNNFSSFK